MKRISIKFDEEEFSAVLYNTPTAKAIFKNLPFEARAQIWGNEIYFTIPVEVEMENDAREEVEKGELAFWPVGSAFCIFFGKTPASIGNEPRAASAVNVFGRIEGKIENLKKVKSQSIIQIKKN